MSLITLIGRFIGIQVEFRFCFVFPFHFYCVGSRSCIPIRLALSLFIFIFIYISSRRLTFSTFSVLARSCFLFHFQLALHWASMLASMSSAIYRIVWITQTYTLTQAPIFTFFVDEIYSFIFKYLKIILSFCM